jgi:hypothetical protein
LKGEDNSQAGQALATKPIPLSSIGRASTLSANWSAMKKKLGLACLFCREWKIACNQPSESNLDQTSSEWLLLVNMSSIIRYYLVNARGNFSNVNAQLSHDGDNIKGRNISQALPNQRWIYKA